MSSLYREHTIAALLRPNHKPIFIVLVFKVRLDTTEPIKIASFQPTFNLELSFNGFVSSPAVHRHQAAKVAQGTSISTCTI